MTALECGVILSLFCNVRQPVHQIDTATTQAAEFRNLSALACHDACSSDFQAVFRNAHVTKNGIITGNTAARLPEYKTTWPVMESGGIHQAKPGVLHEQ